MRQCDWAEKNKDPPSKEWWQRQQSSGREPYTAPSTIASLAQATWRNWDMYLPTMAIRFIAYTLVTCSGPVVADGDLASTTRRAPGALVVDLPGVSADAEAKTMAGGHYSGYLDVPGPNGQKMEMFYYFARHSDAEKPLLIWMNGGPGASSVMGSFAELGPFLINGRSVPSSSNSSWTLFENAHGWSSEASLLVWEQPSGVGFSRCVGNVKCPVWNDESSAAANLQFLHAFYAAFPAERTRKLFIAGESYGGIYVPLLANRILSHNSKAGAQSVAVSGVAVGNGCIGYGIPGGCGADALGMLVELFEKAAPDVDQEALGGARVACGKQLYQGLQPASLTPACREAIARLLEDIGPFNYYHKDGPCGPEEQGNWGEGDAFACGTSAAIKSYMSSLDVQRALHAIPANASQPLDWKTWDGDDPKYNITTANALPEYEQLLSAGVPILVYNGLRDTAVSYNGAERWTKEIGGSIAEPRRLWAAGGVPAGHVIRYARGLTFATVQGAGHLVPADRPLSARVMIAAFLQGLPLPVHEGDKCTPLWLGRNYGHFCDSGNDSKGASTHDVVV